MIDDVEFLICDAASLWRKLFNTQSKWLGISKLERRIIINVDRHPGIPQIEVAHLLEIEPQNLVRPLDKLVSENLIKKSVDTKDRRSNCLFITPQCKDVLIRIHKMANTVRPIALAGIAPEEIQQLKNNLENIKKNLELYLSEKR